MRELRERDIEAYLVKNVKALGGEVRKVQWPGRRNAPDRVVMLRDGKAFYFNQMIVHSGTIWVEVKNPNTVKTFPANAHERAQVREHERMRAAGQVVVVVGTYEQVDELLS